MNVIEPSYQIETDISDELGILKQLERVGRTCYRSTSGDDNKTVKFITDIVKSGHTAILDHFNISVRFICNRGFSHELVRHRLSAYAQESTRYCNYSKGKFGNEITVIKPFYFKDDTNLMDIWMMAMADAEKSYMYLLKSGATPEQARGVLPIDVKTEIVITTDITEWRHILKLRTDAHAHPQMRQLMCPLGKELKEKLPTLFGDLDIPDLEV